MGFSLILYNLGLLVGLVVLSPLWLGYLLLVPKARAGFWEKWGWASDELKHRLQNNNHRKRIWFHAVSVGEFNAIKPLIPELTQDYDVVISNTTRTGHELALKTFPQVPVFYFPYDFPWAISAVVKRIRPDVTVVTETELWPNFIQYIAGNLKKPLLLINGRLSPRSYRGYQWIQWLMKATLSQFSHYYMQSQADADRMQTLGELPPEQLTVAGNLKFDLTPATDEAKKAELAQLLGIQEAEPVLTFASTHSGEDAPLLEAFLQLKKTSPELKLILAPRHPERVNEIRAILNNKALGYTVRSQLSAEEPNRQDIVVLDSIGELLTVYSLSHIAVMGGSFVDKGGQNPLEPISQRVPVIFGPHMDNFAEISRMILENEAGYQVSNPTELINAVMLLLTQPEIYDSVAEKGQLLLENNRGAKAIILKAIQAYAAN